MTLHSKSNPSCNGGFAWISRTAGAGSYSKDEEWQCWRNLWTQNRLTQVIGVTTRERFGDPLGRFLFASTKLSFLSVLPGVPFHRERGMTHRPTFLQLFSLSILSRLDRSPPFPCPLFPFGICVPLFSLSLSLTLTHAENIQYDNNVSAPTLRSKVIIQVLNEWPALIIKSNYTMPPTIPND